MYYFIGEFAERVGLGIHTLRYYEKEKLLIPDRDSGNRRRYSEQDITWITFIKRLKDTGMPIKEIRLYAQLRAEGNATLFPRMELLQNHRSLLVEEIRLLQEHLKSLDNKIEYYKREILSLEE